MKVTLTISDRDIGLVMRCLMDCEKIERNGARKETDVEWIARVRAHADRIRAIRKDLAAQRKSPPAPTVVQSAVDRLVERVRKAYPNG